MRGVNKVTLVGNLGADPEVRYTPAGSAVANIKVATSESWLDKQNGNREERTEWHRVVMFGKLAEIAAQYLKKGGQVYVEGKLRTRKWADNQGIDRYTTEVVAAEMQMLGVRGPVAPARNHEQEHRQVSGSDVRAAESHDSDESPDVPF